MRTDSQNGQTPSAHRNGLRRAAALRWVISSRGDAATRVHELLEFDAARRVLNRLERSCPGLREFVDYVESLATLAANLQAAERAEVPAWIAADYRRDLDQKFMELPARKAQLKTEHLDQVLAAYAALADPAGMLELEPNNALEQSGRALRGSQEGASADRGRMLRNA